MKAHTTLPVGYLYGIEKVRESLEDDVRTYLEAIFNEICPWIC